MMKVICCRSSPSRWRIGQRCFSRLFSARARRVLAREILRRCSKRSNASRLQEVICRNGESEQSTPHLNPLPSEGRGGQQVRARYNRAASKRNGSPRRFGQEERARVRS